MTHPFRQVLAALFLVGSAACHYTRHTTTSDLDSIAALAGVDLPPAIQDFAWLEGAWRGAGLGGVVEEAWSAPADGAMVGHFRLTKDGVVAFYEIMTIDADDSGRLGLRVKHFHPDLRGWEEKEESAMFPLEGIEGDRFRFRGLTLKRVSDDEMEMAIRMRREDGSVGEEVLTYRRVR